MRRRGSDAANHGRPRALKPDHRLERVRIAVRRQSRSRPVGGRRPKPLHPCRRRQNGRTARRQCGSNRAAIRPCVPCAPPPAQPRGSGRRPESGSSRARLSAWLRPARRSIRPRRQPERPTGRGGNERPEHQRHRQAERRGPRYHPADDERGEDDAGHGQRENLGQVASKYCSMTRPASLQPFLRQILPRMRCSPRQVGSLVPQTDADPQTASVLA